jgi:hypothetical protein
MKKGKNPKNKIKNKYMKKSILNLNWDFNSCSKIIG